MEFLGSKFSLTLGAWRLHVGFGLEEVQDEVRHPHVSQVHHVIHPRDYSKVR
ncbi:MAG: hypothetical protein NVSMB31_19110 [Vulcanimicrobiaceae bacterium]